MSESIFRDEKKEKNIKRDFFIKLLPLLVLCMGILGTFCYYLVGNRARIIGENARYIEKSATQDKYRIDFIFKENLEMIESIAYLYGAGLSSKEVDLELLTKMEKNTSFDLIRFVDGDGMNHTTDGQEVDCSNRKYFLDGMQGISGITEVFSSRVNGETMIGFYAPVIYQGETIGVMVGFFRQNSLTNLLRSYLFGYPVETYIVRQDGMIIAGSSPKQVRRNFLSKLEDPNEFSEEEGKRILTAFKNGNRITFTFRGERTESKGRMIPLTSTGWYLVQEYPAQATYESMKSSNKIVSLLSLVLIALFAVYIVYLLWITRRQRKQLEESNRYAGYVTEGIKAMVDRFVVVDLEEGTYEYIYSAPNSERIEDKGSYADIVDFVFTDIFLPEERENLEDILQVEYLRKKLAKKHSILSFTLRAATKEERWETLSAICIETKDDKAKKLLFIRQNATELKSREIRDRKALEDAYIAAERANKAKSTFLSNMSHDIRTPMNAIIGFASLAKSHISQKDRVEDYLSKILSSGNHLLNLINDVLDMSRIESGRMQIEETKCNLSELLNGLKNMFLREIEEKQLEFVVDTADVFDDEIYADSLHLNQVLLNLVSNAVKFTGNHGRISIRAIEKGGAPVEHANYEIRVKDNGIGMSEEFLNKVFLPFEREQSSTASGILGTGLGMSITKNIIDMMGGTILVNSKKGIGTEFIVNLTLRLQTERQGAPVEVKGEAETTSFEGKRILLVEDNDFNREIACEVLEMEGLLVETARNGKQGVDKILEKEWDYYDLVLMDIQMPGMNGYEATQAIRACEDKRSEIPIIALTANAFEEDKLTALASGMNAHISKPIDIKELFHCMNEIFTNKKEG